MEMKEEMEKKEMENVIDTQEIKEETKANNDIIETKEAENEITNIEKSENNSVPPDNSSKQELKGNYPECVLKYYDPSVLLTNSQELDTVNYYFDSVSCYIEGISNLLFEMDGYALAETAKLNKLFILKGEGRNGKSKVFRPLETILDDKCSHEHLEQLSRK